MMIPELIHKILVATDGSEPSIQAARYAAAIAKCSRAEVVVLNVAEVSTVTQFVGYSVAASGRLPAESGEHIVERTKKVFLEADVQAHTKVVEGYAAEVILHEAREGKYDLIAVGSRGVGGAFREHVGYGLGSVAERVVDNSECALLVVRA